MTLATALAACGGSTQKADQSWKEVDDHRAGPECGNDCVSAQYGDADIREVILRVSRCWKHPVYVEPDLQGTVSVEFSYLTCAEALQRVAEAGGLQVMAIEGTEATGQILAGGAIALTRSKRPADLVDVTALAEADPADTGELVGDGWSRDLDDADDGDDAQDDRPGANPPRNRDSAPDTSATSARQRRSRQAVCKSKCRPAYSSCRRDCSGAASTETCYARCQQQKDSCERPCDAL